MRHADVHEAMRAAEDIASGLEQLNERSREIFKRIVETYLATGVPVGSRNLSRALPMTLSPASVRNVMSDLENLGLIYAPHTSAGRLPTQTGLRLFIDGLLEVGEIGEAERSQIERRMAGGPPTSFFTSLRPGGSWTAFSPPSTRWRRWRALLPFALATRR